jgi:hypothetical protein
VRINAFRALGIDALLERALRVGAATHEVLQRKLTHKRHPGEIIREALGILRLAQDFDIERLEKTAAEALELGLFSYGAIHDLIKRPRTTVQTAAPSRLGVHPNVRGAEYYQ